MNEQHAQNGAPYGLTIPDGLLVLGGHFHVEHYRDGVLLDEFDSDNLVTNEGINHVLNVLANGATQLSWYAAIFEGNYQPLATDTAATIVANSTESTAYDESTRQVWNPADSSAKSLTNAAARATFTINATKTIYGAFIISSSAKSSATGTLLAAAKFSTPRSVQDDDQLFITYILNGSST
jgi:hypothetical protein